MSIQTLLVTVAALALAAPALAEIEIKDAYARAAMPNARAGGAFMRVANTGAEDDRLVSATSDIAAKTEFHTNVAGADGVMKMLKVEEGFVIPAGGEHALVRGGDHVMFMGLTRPLNDGDVVSVTFTFEKAGDVTVEIPVDLKRQE